MRSRLVPFRCGSVPASARSPRQWPRIRRQPSDSLAMPRSEDRLAARLPPARDSAVSAGHLPPVQRHKAARKRVVMEGGEIEESVLPRHIHPSSPARTPRRHPRLGREELAHFQTNPWKLSDLLTRLDEGRSVLTEF